MRVHPDEFVELKYHGLMKLRCAVARAMVLPPSERSRAKIVREGKPSVLRFTAIRDLSKALGRAPRASKRR
jgi:hypothetical protein